MKITALLLVAGLAATLPKPLPTPDVQSAPIRVVTRGETGAAGTALVAAASVGISDSVVAGLADWVDP